MNGTDRLRFAPAERSGAAEFPPHLFEPEGLSEPERPPSAAPPLFAPTGFVFCFAKCAAII
ncbi:hypothetical protein A2W39_02160 [Candidatus Azambacteria bacterium RIFCSPHIGHO2_01_46_10]|uniref:Uncharacterized protein n=1 Tax=Candidatus Azambacteria bacterium RIFCSPHIGHO2_01_46_10 TaxID=1797293 RepID=A0A1F5BWY3_9BACT|nr:MAG: hypothetical protein A2W39_02160 [Candidatus Azambacteria bacterium RIFCSPHIGHO2_01_46_10]